MGHMDEVAPPRRRRQELTEDYYRDGTWRIPGGGQLPKDRDMLLDQLPDEEQRAAVLKQDYERKRSAMEKAQRDFREASAEYTKQENRVDVLKLAIAEALGVPE